MECEICKKKSATMQVKTTRNGQITILNLCASCARERGIGNIFSAFDIGDLVGSILNSETGNADQPRCSKCGSLFAEISKSGKIGCAQCYETFKDQLSPMVQRIHGSAVHRGKRPGGSALSVLNQSKGMVPADETRLNEKRRLLKQAIESQEFEEAAKLRDEIKEMEA